MSKVCFSGSSSPALPSAALMPPSAAPEWLRVGWSFEMTPTSAPASCASIAARMPAQPAPTTSTSCFASTSSSLRMRPCVRAGDRRSARPSSAGCSRRSSRASARRGSRASSSIRTGRCSRTCTSRRRATTAMPSPSRSTWTTGAPSGRRTCSQTRSRVCRRPVVCGRWRGSRFPNQQGTLVNAGEPIASSSTASARPLRGDVAAAAADARLEAFESRPQGDAFALAIRVTSRIASSASVDGLRGGVADWRERCDAHLRRDPRSAVTSRAYLRLVPRRRFRRTRSTSTAAGPSSA